MITYIVIFITGSAKCEIICADNSKVEITIPAEALEGLDMDKRYAKIMERGNAYISAQCANSEPADERSVATEAK